MPHTCPSDGGWETGKKVTGSVDQFTTSIQHILAELGRIDLLIRAQVWRAQQLQEVDEFRGLHISDSDVERLLAQSCGLPQWATESTPLSLETMRSILQRMAEDIQQRKTAAAARGVNLRLDRLVHLFGLSEFDRDALLICLAPELDLRYERLFAYLHDDVNKKRPTIDLILNLLCVSAEDKLSQRNRFLAAAPLRHQRLLELLPGAEDVLLARKVRLDARIVDYLLDASAQIDDDSSQEPVAEPIAAYVRLVAPCVSFSDLGLPVELRQKCMQLADPSSIGPRGLVLGLQGPYGVGKRAVAEAFCASLGLSMLWVDVPPLSANTDSTFAELIHLIMREAVFGGAAIFFAGFDTLLAEDRTAQLDMLVHAIEHQHRFSFLATEGRWTPSDTLRTVPYLHIELPRPTYSDRLHLWQEAFDSIKVHGVAMGDCDLHSLASKFRFTGGQIQDAVATAVNLARWRNPEQPKIADDDLYAASRLHSNQKLATLAQKLVPTYTWNDIVLPADQMRQLHEICDQVKYRAQVYEEWGFGNKLALGKGVNALFAGPPGTGKTMAAEIIASELGLDIYKIDLSTVVSKFIGETEKNLSKIFAEAEASNAILFFDEADALFGKRSEVRDSHDRYANIETGYLLQRLEEYEGVVILATNFARNLDDAFMRRLQFTVEFPFPSEEERHQIWERIWPKRTPCDPGLDLDFAARELKLAGGNIRNIAVAATFLAAADGQVVTMEHLVHATRREFQKMGRVVVPDEFGVYADYLRRE